MRALINIFAQVFRSIGANKLRSFLTMFGIAWGVASLLLLIGLGEGFRSGQRRGLAELGTDVIMMWGGTIPVLPEQHVGMRPYKLTMSDAAAIRAQVPDVRNVTAIINRSDLKQVSDFSSAGGQVLGVELNYPRDRESPHCARTISESAGSGRATAGSCTRTENGGLFFPGRPPLGALITLNGYRFQVIGVAKKVGRGNNDGPNQRIYIPLTTMQEFFPITGDNIPQDSISQIQYQPLTEELNETAKSEVHKIIATRHGFDPARKEGFEEWDTIKSNRMVGLIFTAMDVFLGGVGIVTLALGAVGIINIMLVTVTERTKEIGLRKALGATNRSILFQFFLEGLTLTALSGFIGIIGAAALMAALGSVVGNNDMGFDPPRLVPWSAAMAMGTLTLCGIVAGLYPARQAAMLAPVEALRKE